MLMSMLMLRFILTMGDVEDWFFVTTTRCQYSWCIYLARAVPEAIGGWYLLEWDGAVGSYKYLSWRRVLHQPGMAASIFEDGTHTVSLPELSRRWTKGGRGEKLRKKKLRKRGWGKNGQRARNSRGMKQAPWRQLVDNSEQVPFFPALNIFRLFVFLGLVQLGQKLEWLPLEKQL